MNEQLVRFVSALLHQVPAGVIESAVAAATAKTPTGGSAPQDTYARALVERLIGENEQ